MNTPLVELSLCTGCGKPLYTPDQKVRCLTWDEQDRVWHTECFNRKPQAMLDHKPMTAKELIALLQPFSGDLEVRVLYDSKQGCESITGICKVENDAIYLDTTGN